MKYFLHDTNAFNDEKVTELFIKFGFEGVGLFYTVLERIAAQEKPIKTSVLKKQLQVGKRLEKCWSFMEEIGIISSSNGETFNERILSYSEKYRIRKEKNREKVARHREEQAKNEEDIKNVTSYETVTLPDCNPSKVKESKVKESKYINIEFSKFWDLYDKKKGDIKKLKKKWDNLTDKDRQDIMDYIPLYKQEQPDKVYRKNPETFFNQESWKDEIITPQKFVSNGTHQQTPNGSTGQKSGTSAARVEALRNW